MQRMVKPVDCASLMKLLGPPFPDQDCSTGARPFHSPSCQDL